MFTSHYGQRQGIYQPMESFKSSNWRASQITVLSKVYRYKANTRILIPPNSFPARSLTKQTNQQRIFILPSSQLPVPKTMFSTPHGQILTPHLSAPREFKYSPSIANPAPRKAVATKHNVSSAKSECSTQLKRSSMPHTSSSTRHSSHSSSLSSVTAKLHPRPSFRSHISQRKSVSRNNFPYPDPTKIEGNSSFAARLVNLAKLECETVKQEVFFPANRPSSACSMPSSTSLKSYDTTNKQSTAVKKRELNRTKVECKKNSYCRGHTCVQEREASTDTKSVSCIEVSHQEDVEEGEGKGEREESTSDLGVSIESLCLSEDVMEKQVGEQNQVGELNQARESSSSCSLRGHRASSKGKGKGQGSKSAKSKNASRSRIFMK